MIGLGPVTPFVIHPRGYPRLTELKLEISVIRSKLSRTLKFHHSFDEIVNSRELTTQKLIFITLFSV